MYFRNTYHLYIVYVYVYIYTYIFVCEYTICTSYIYNNIYICHLYIIYTYIYCPCMGFNDTSPPVSQTGKPNLQRTNFAQGIQQLSPHAHLACRRVLIWCIGWWGNTMGDHLEIQFRNWLPCWRILPFHNILSTAWCLYMGYFEDSCGKCMLGC